MKLRNLKPDALNIPFRKHLTELVSNAGGSGTLKLSTGGAALGAGFDAVSASKQERAFLGELVEEYRPEIAERLGLAAEQVTQQHFEQVFMVNPVLAQAKEATKTGAKTRSVAGVVSTVSGLLAGLGAAALTRNAQTGDAQKNAGNIAGGLASTIGAMVAGRFTRGIMKRKGADHALQDTAHAYIMEIKSKQMRGETTSAADIFKVQLAVNPELNKAIADQLGARFENLDEEAQLELMRREAPEVLEVNEEMAKNINAGARPQGLLFGEVEQVLKPVGPEVVEEAQQALPPELEAALAAAGQQGKAADQQPTNPPAQLASEESKEAAKQPPFDVGAEVHEAQPAANGHEMDGRRETPDNHHEEEKEFSQELESFMAGLEDELADEGKKTADKAPKSDIDPSFVEKLEREREQVNGQEAAASR